MLYDIMRLQVCLLQVRCQRHHRYRRRKQASVIILKNNDRTPAALLRAMRNHLYEITKEIFDRLENGLSDWDVYKIIDEGRHLYMDVNDRCGPPYTIVFDDDYKKLCPWAKIISSGRVWPDELTDAAVEIFASEGKNREQRRKKREKREKREKKETLEKKEE